MKKITDYALKKNQQGIELTTKKYLQKIVKDKVNLTYLELQKSIEQVTILGKVGQRIIDNFDNDDSLAELSRYKLFLQELIEYKGALLTRPEDEFHVIIPKSVVTKSRTKNIVSLFSLLTLVMPSVHEANHNNTMTWFATEPEHPVGYGYPNLDAAAILGDHVNDLFWTDWFPDG